MFVHNKSKFKEKQCVNVYSMLFKIKERLFFTPHFYQSHTVNAVDAEALCKDPASHRAKQLIYSGDNNNPGSANTQMIPPITLTYLRDDNIFLPLRFTLHRVKLMARRHDVINTTAGVWWMLHPAPSGRPIGGPWSCGQWKHWLKSQRGPDE